MSTLFAHRLADEGNRLLLQAERVLSASSDERLRRLALRLPRPDDTQLKVVVTGAYNAGKSTLLKALTGDDILIDADVATQRTTPYPWHGLLLVDTPGVKAGVENLHDEIAEQAVRDADLVLFVLTLGFFDDETVKHFRHVLVNLHKLPQTLVILNKNSQKAVSDDICRAELIRALDQPGLPLPEFARCDARDFLLAGDESDSDEREELLASSRIRVVEEAIDRLSKTKGPAGQLLKPFEAVLATVADIRPLLTPTDEERSLRELLAVRRRELAESRIRLRDGAEAVFAKVSRAIVSEGEALIASVEDGIPRTENVDLFDGRCRSLAESLGPMMQTVFDNECDHLIADARALEGRPQVALLEAAVDAGFGREVPDGAAGAPPDAASMFASFLGEQVQRQAKSWIQGAVKEGARPGSPAHSVIYEGGKLLGVKFKPWGAVKWAKRLNVAGQVSFALFDMYQQMQGADAEERNEQQAVRALRTAVFEVATDLTDEARIQLEPLITNFYASVAEEDTELSGNLDGREKERNQLNADFDQLEREATAGFQELRGNEFGSIA
jgi:hypothetical protein